MQTLADSLSMPPSRRQHLMGSVLSGLCALFLVLDACMKLALVAPATAASIKLGFSPDLTRPLGILELACVTLYLTPRLAPLGALLLIGYFGGAVATHLRLEAPLFSHTLFPVYMGALVWLGLWLRDARLRRLVVWAKE